MASYFLLHTSWVLNVLYLKINILKGMATRIGRTTTTEGRTPSGRTTSAGRSTLRIEPYLERIYDLINTSEAVLVIAPTGSGKSVGIPEHILKKNPNSRVLISVPTVTATRALTEFLTSRVRFTVGSGADERIEYNENTSVVYATAGHVRRKFLSYFREGLPTKHIEEFDYILVDEFHGGTIDNHLIIALWNLCRGHEKCPKLVVMSATADVGKLKQLVPHVETFYIDEIPGYKVTIEYIDDVIGKVQGLQIKRDYKNTVNILPVLNKILEDTTGDVLVFVSGKADINEIMYQLKGRRLKVLKAHGELRKDELNALNDMSDDRKVIIATNVAESSVTIPNISVVVDSMFENRVETTPSGGKIITKVLISKSSAQQRAGRTGRTISGVCYRLITRTAYQKLDEQKPDEVELAPIYKIILELLDKSLDVYGIFPSSTKLKVTIDDVLRLLTDYQFIENDVPTDLGMFSVDVPLDIRTSKVLWDWMKAELPLFPGIVSVVMIDQYGPAYTVKEHRGSLGRFKGNDDIESYLKVWSHLMEEMGGPLNLEYSLVRRICRDNNLIESRVIKWMATAVKISKRLNGIIGPFNPVTVCQKLRPIITGAYSNVIAVKGKPMTEVYILNNEIYILGDGDGFNNTYADKLVVLSSITSPTRSIITLAASAVEST